MPTHHLYFERISHPGSGFKFPCNAAGEVTDLNPKQAVQFSICRDNRWQEFRQPVVVPADAISETKAVHEADPHR